MQSVRTWSEQFLLTRLLRGATRLPLCLQEHIYISTHTPLARRDGESRYLATLKYNFYSHASCEARQRVIKALLKPPNFYSHASCEARHCHIPETIPYQHFYSHASCEARLPQCAFNIDAFNFYSHASCEARLWCYERHNY